MPSWLKIALSAVAGLAIGVAIGIRIGGDPPLESPASPRVDESNRRAAADPLPEQLERERRRRAALEEELAGLRAALPAKVAPAAGDETEAPPHDEVAEASEEGNPIFDEAALREAGASDAEIRRLRELNDGLEMDLLYLRDTARREGWLRTPRLRNEAQQLRESLRAEIGDDDYDALLYAGGRNNRVIVTDVLANSPAAGAGLQAGDSIVRYAGERIFDVASLVRATARAEPGDSIEVRFRRGGSEERAFLPSGPIGVRLRRGRQQPDTLR